MHTAPPIFFILRLLISALKVENSGCTMCILVFLSSSAHCIQPSHLAASSHHSSQPGRNSSQPGTDSSQPGRDSSHSRKEGRVFSHPGRNSSQSGCNSSQAGRTQLVGPRMDRDGSGCTLCMLAFHPAVIDFCAEGRKCYDAHCTLQFFYHPSAHPSHHTLHTSQEETPADFS